MTRSRRSARRIAAIEQRTGKVEKGDDILLSVITDGRHAAINTRFVLGADTAADPRAGDEPGNKLNALIATCIASGNRPQPTATSSLARPGYPRSPERRR